MPCQYACVDARASLGTMVIDRFAKNGFRWRPVARVVIAASHELARRPHASACAHRNRAVPRTRRQRPTARAEGQLRSTPRRLRNLDHVRMAAGLVHRRSNPRSNRPPRADPVSRAAPGPGPTAMPAAQARRRQEPPRFGESVEGSAWLVFYRPARLRVHANPAQRKRRVRRGRRGYFGHVMMLFLQGRGANDLRRPTLKR
jgi:hypothetical protein